MAWIEQLREVLQDFFPEAGPADVLGYFKGTGGPNIWRMMARQNQPQMMILGSVPPTQEQWVAAGKPGPDPIQTVHNADMTGLIVIYGGFVYRPWGRIETLDTDALKYYQQSTIDYFRRAVQRG